MSRPPGRDGAAAGCWTPPTDHPGGVGGHDDPATAPAVLLIATLCGAQVLEVLGVTVVIVALPVIGADLGLGEGALALVVSLYAVLYGSLLLAAGRLADVVGRRTVLVAGLVATGAGTLVCATAPTGTVLLVGRAVQGLGGALVTPAALGLLTTSFPTGAPRRRAVSAWTAAAAGGGALGYGAGGVLVDLVGWRAIFWLLTALVVVLLGATLRRVPVVPAAAVRRGLDPAGTATAVTGLVLLVLGAGLVEDPGAAPVPPLAVVATGVVLLGAFLLTQWHGRDPLLDRTALTHRRFLRANAVAFVNAATTSSSGTLVALAAVEVLGLRPIVTGLVLLPLSVMVVLGSATGGFWLRRPEHVGMASGLAVVAVAMGGMALAVGARSPLLMAAAAAVAGLGLSWASVTSTDAATAALPAERQGTAAGAVSTAAQVGTALGIAVLVGVAGLVGDGGGPGFVVAFTVAAVVAGGTGALVLALRRGVDRPATGHPGA